MWIKDINILLDVGMHEKVDEKVYIHVDEGMDEQADAEVNIFVDQGIYKNLSDESMWMKPWMRRWILK